MRYDTDNQVGYFLVTEDGRVCAGCGELLTKPPARCYNCRLHFHWNGCRGPRYEYEEDGSPENIPCILCEDDS